MCGIVAYDGSTEALPVIVGGLRKLEYRGYDSAGVALVEDGHLAVHKQTGVIDDLELPTSSPSTCALGHTRWSTHGPPTDANAHPHTDCTGRIAVVHNGIIENFEALKADLDGHDFTSETDTEVIVHLIEDALDDSAPSLREAVEAVVDRLDGSYAFAVVAAGHDGIVGARQDSPLVIGHGDGENFLASDVTAFVDHTQRVTYLEDGDVVHVADDGVTVYVDGAVTEREVHEVDWEPEAAERGGYAHYMLKEIHDQPRALRQAIAGRIDELNHEATLEVGLPREYLNSLEEVQIVAAGTSYHAGLYARELLETHADVRVTVEIASEYEFEGGRDPWRTLVIAISQSGETADTLTAIREAARAGARTLAVTNTVGSTLAREVDEAVFIRAGPEIGVAATKTFCSQVATMALLTVYLGRTRGSMTAEAAGELLDGLRGLPGAVQQVLDDEAAIREIAETYADGEAFFFIGRKLGYPVALEGALKLKEIAYVHAEGFAAGELKHGPLALVTESTPVIALLNEGARPRATLNNVKEVQARGAPVIGATSLTDVEKVLDETIEVASLGELEPIVSNVILQLFAYHVAALLDRPIDKPRNLAKSVTVE